MYAFARLIWLLGVFAVAWFAALPAFAQSTAIVQTMKNLATNNVINGVDCTQAAANRWTGWLQVSDKRNVVFDVDFTDADSSAASLDVTCETSTSSATAQGAGRDLPVITSTAATGVNSMTISTWRWVSTTGGAPGTSSFVLYIQNIPAPWLACLFTCGAGDRKSVV